MYQYNIYPLGDTAFTIEFAGKISEQVNEEVIARYLQLKRSGLPGLIEVSPAYNSVSVFYDPLLVARSPGSIDTAYERIKEQVIKVLQIPPEKQEDQKRILRIPVCYEPTFAPDLHALASIKQMEPAELAAIHCSVLYRVYMLGFLPGFPYLATVDERIAAPRKNQPVTVTAGSVGIAGNQTGIYPFTSPGGWQIIGRIPFRIFDPQKDEPALFAPGDHVQFYPVTEKEFLINQKKDPWELPS
jgi:inhibitor of KinA